MATIFLLAGTVYSDLPYDKVAVVREKNRRLGLGLMGIHEWLLKRGKKYGPDAELEMLLGIYTHSTSHAWYYADKWGISRPVKTRAIAPTGTLSIVGETTSGIEPLLCVAYKRRYLKGTSWHYQYVIDPTAKRLIESGVRAESIEDCYVLAGEVERRLAFQAWVQKYVDHSISSTINLPGWGSEGNNSDGVTEFGTTLMKYLPDIRGITTYPDGARGGQPLNPVSYSTASRHYGKSFEESGETAVLETGDVCDITRGGTCSS
jgi:ribonucleoside-diphosphate reductase alpha chain